MGTPLADRIRKKAQETAAKPITPVGATGAMTQQAAVSSTGKAAAPGAATAQSAVGEASVAAQGQAQQDATASSIQDAGEQMAVTEQAADVKQSGVDAAMAQKKLVADNEFNNKMTQFMSRVNMNQSKEEQDNLALEMKQELMTQRLTNNKYIETMQNIADKKGLKSKEDFSIEASETAMNRAILTGDEGREHQKYVQDYKRDKAVKLRKQEIEIAKKQAQADVKKGWKADVTDHLTGGLSSGDSSNASGMMSKFGPGSKKETETDEGTA